MRYNPSHSKTLIQYYCYQVTLHQFGKSLQTYHLLDNEVDNDSSSSPPSPQLPAECPDTRTEARTEISLTPFLAEIDQEEKSVLNGKICVYKGRYVHITAVLENVPDIICKISDGKHWITVKFNQQNQHLFITGCFKAGQIVRVMTSGKDSDENQIVIVSFIETLNQL